jgi:hypothetical protein
VLFLFSYSSCAIAAFFPVNDFGLPPFLPRALAAFIFTSLSDNRTLLAVGTAIERQMSGENPTSQSPTASPRNQLPAAPKRKKLLESGFEIEAGNEKERRGKGMG